MGNAPIWEIMNSLGKGIADAQYAMDDYVFKAIQRLASPEEKITVAGQSKSLLELGLMPSFYHFSEVNLNIKMAISSMQGEEFGGEAMVAAGGGVGLVMFGASLSASYSNKYSFSANAASEVSAKIISIPPPSELKDLISKSIANKQPIEGSSSEGEE